MHIARIGRRIETSPWARFGPALLGFLLLGLFAESAYSIPRYSARYEQDCNLCHINPTGGGMRSLYAQQYLVPQEMTVIPKDDEQMERLSPAITDAFSIGLDVRTLHLYSADKSHRNNFLQMQGDFYALVEFDPRFSVYLDQGQSQTRELFGLAYVLPANGYVKLGRFTPAFGWKYADHNLFVRDMLGLAPPTHTDVGLEFGTYPGALGFEVGVFNGSPGSIADTDHRVGFVSRASFRKNIAGLAFLLGGSFAYNETNGGIRRMGGPFGYLNLGRVTWVGEVDWSQRESAGSRPDALVTSHELSVALTQGFDLRATYDFYDPDVDQKSGSRFKFGFGIDSLIYPFFGVQAMVNRWDFEEGEAVGTATAYTQSVLMFHLFY